MPIHPEVIPQQKDSFCRQRDRAGPIESLRAATGFYAGPGPFRVLLGEDSLRCLLTDRPSSPGTEVRGERGEYLVLQEFHLEGGGARDWIIALDTGLSHVKVTQEPEKNWGLFTVKRRPKYAIYDLYPELKPLQGQQVSEAP